MGRRTMRLDRDSIAVSLGRLGMSPLLAQQLAEVGARPRVARFQTERLAEAGLGRGVLALEVERHAEATVQRRALGPDPNRRAIRSLGLDRAALAAKAHRQIRKRHDVVRIEPDGFAQRGFRLDVSALTPERDA